MKSFGVIFVLLFSFQTFASTKNLPDFLKKNKATVESQMTQKYEYTFKVDYDAMKCLERQSEIGTVGVCLVQAAAIEESVTAVFSITVSSHYSGTGSEAREIEVSLVDYQL